MLKAKTFQILVVLQIWDCIRIFMSMLYIVSLVMYGNNLKR